MMEKNDIGTERDWREILHVAAMFYAADIEGVRFKNINVAVLGAADFLRMAADPKLKAAALEHLHPTPERKNLVETVPDPAAVPIPVV